MLKSIFELMKNERIQTIADRCMVARDTARRTARGVRQLRYDEANAFMGLHGKEKDLAIKYLEMRQFLLDLHKETDNIKLKNKIYRVIFK